MSLNDWLLGGGGQGEDGDGENYNFEPNINLRTSIFGHSLAPLNPNHTDKVHSVGLHRYGPSIGRLIGGERKERRGSGNKLERLLLLRKVVVGESFGRVVQFCKINFIMLISNTNFVSFYVSLSPPLSLSVITDTEGPLFIHINSSWGRRRNSWRMRNYSVAAGETTIILWYFGPNWGAASFYSHFCCCWLLKRWSSSG